MENNRSYIFWFNRWNLNREDLIMKVLHFSDHELVENKSLKILIFFIFTANMKRIYKGKHHTYIEGLLYNLSFLFSLVYK